MPRGGKRPGAGKPKGVRWPSVMEREAAKKAYAQAVIAKLQPIVETELGLGLGQFAEVCVVELAEGGLKLRLVTTDQELKELCEGGRAYRVMLREPDGQMLRYVTDQAIGKPEGASITTTVETGPNKTVVKHEHIG